MTSIFDRPENFVEGGENFPFKKVGDKIEGTYISKGTMISNFGGDELMTYRLKCADGKIRYVISKPSIDRQMKGVKLGQIIGFIYAADVPSKKGGNPFHDIKVAQNPNVVDKEWLAEWEAGEKAADTAEEVFNSGAQEEPFQSPSEVAGEETIIMEMAAKKLGTTPETVKTKVMEVLQIAYVPSNYAAIIAALDKLPDAVK